MIPGEYTAVKLVNQVDVLDVLVYDKRISLIRVSCWDLKQHLLHFLYLKRQPFMFL